MKTTMLFLATATAALVACGDNAVTGTDAPEFSRESPAASARGLVVMTRNVYLGVELGPVMTAPAEQIPVAAAGVWSNLQYTNFPERAGRLAAEIVAHNPHLVGLQEVALYRTQTPSDAIFGGATPATTVAFDFLRLIQDSLRARGAHYEAVAVDRTSDVEVPAFVGMDRETPQFMDIRFTDGDAILVRANVRHSNAAMGRYQWYIPLEVGGRALGLYRGWGAVDAEVDGTTFRFVNTHLEDMSPEVQVGQATELLAMLRHEKHPIVMVGDFNSDVLTNATPTYGMLQAAGFADMWAEANPHQAGATCCNVELLNNTTPGYDQRLDLVLVRGERHERFVEHVSATLVGDRPSDRTSHGLWPSDHAGVVAVLRTTDEGRGH